MHRQYTRTAMGHIALLTLLASACPSSDPDSTDPGSTGDASTGATSTGDASTGDASTGEDSTGADSTGTEGEQGVPRESSASQPDPLVFSGSASVEGAAVFEVLPGPSAIDPAFDPTPFSDSVANTQGSYSLSVIDTDPTDSVDSMDAVENVEILFTGNDGRNYLIDSIDVIHKPKGAGEHTFFGGVGHNETMHGDTGVGTELMPKMLAYITLWGIADLRDADTLEVVAPGRLVHIMTATRVRNADQTLITEVEMDGSDHDRLEAETHVILPPQNMAGEMSPVPGTDHGFLHMMYSNVELAEPNRDPTLVYEILPGPSAIDPELSPTPFSDKIAVASGSYSLVVRDFDEEDSPTSRDEVESFDLSFRLDDGTEYTIDGIDVVHKEAGTGDHSFLGGVGYDVTMHGDTGLGTGLMPKMTSYITLWGMVDLRDAKGAIVAENRSIHIMVSGRVRDENLALGTDVVNDASDPSDDRVETHIILPPTDPAGEMSPIPGTRHGFLHLMFEEVSITTR